MASSIESKSKFRSHSQFKTSVPPYIPNLQPSIGPNHGQELLEGGGSYMSWSALLHLLAVQNWGGRKEKRKNEKYPFLAAAADVLCLSWLALPVSDWRLPHLGSLGVGSLDYLKAPEDLPTVQLPDISVRTHTPSDVLLPSTPNFCSYPTIMFCWDDLQGSLDPVTFQNILLAHGKLRHPFHTECGVRLLLYCFFSLPSCCTWLLQPPTFRLLRQEVGKTLWVL